MIATALSSRSANTVLIPATITNLSESTPDYCSVTLQSVEGRRPDGLKETFCINAAVLALYER